MNTQKMNELKEMLCREMEDIVGKGELSAGDLEVAYKASATIKNLCKIKMLEEYSNDGSYDGGSYDGYSRGHYVRGHYSRDGYSRDGGSYRYSRDGETDKMREEIRKCLEEMR